MVLRACGVILFKWVTGELPFKTDEPDSRAGKVIASQVVSCQFSYPETAVLSSRVKDLLSHILVRARPPPPLLLFFKK